MKRLRQCRANSKPAPVKVVLFALPTCTRSRTKPPRRMFVLQPDVACTFLPTSRVTVRVRYARASAPPTRISNRTSATDNTAGPDVWQAAHARAVTYTRR